MSARLIGVETGKILWTGKYSQSGTCSDTSKVSQAVCRVAKSIASAFPSRTGEKDTAEAEPDPPPVASAAPEKEESKDSRSRWVSDSYPWTLRHVKGKSWVQMNSQTEKTDLHLTETERTPDYIELSGFGFGKARVLDKRMDMPSGNGWGWVSNGHWVTKSKSP
jgi:hypothetical protein